MIFDIADVETGHPNRLAAASYPFCPAVFTHDITETSQFSQQRPLSTQFEFETKRKRRLKKNYL